MRKLNTDLPEFIYQFTITSLIDLLNQEKVDTELPWNGFGGSVYAGQRFADYLNNKDFNITARITGIAASMNVALLPFFDKVIGANQSDIMFHSASGGGSDINNINKFLYEALKQKIDEAKFKEVTGFEFKKIMLAKGDDRRDVWIRGDKAKYIGLFDETFDLLDKAATINHKPKAEDLDYDLPENIAIKYGFKKETKINNDMEIKDVTVSMLKTGNVDVYNEVAKEVLEKEQNRVTAIMKYAQYDMEKANQIVKSGAELTTEDVEHFMEKKYNKDKVDELEDKSEEALKAAKVTKDQEEDKEKEAAITELSETIGINKYLKEDK